jgi:hypothetical protein
LLEVSVDVHPRKITGERIAGAVVGTLVGFSPDGATPLVIFARQEGSAAVPARTIVDLAGSDIGRQAVLMFEEGDPLRPIVIGRLRTTEACSAPVSPHVRVEADGERLLLSARNSVVLRCGKASITLTKEGKILVQGAYVSNQSSGVLRIKGGSVQIN